MSNERIQDEHLELQVQQQLTACEDLASTPIKIAASDGVITLTGEVQSFRRKLKAQEVVSSLSNVESVINDLVVSHLESSSGIDLAVDVNKHLQKDARLMDQAIRVDVRDTEVTLSGYVKAEADRDVAADIATSTGGVREVTNLLIVNPDSVAANIELRRTIFAAISSIIGMENENLILCVIDETARISGTVDDVWKKEAAEATVHQFGILNVCNEIEVNPSTL